LEMVMEYEAPIQEVLEIALWSETGVQSRSTLILVFQLVEV